MRTVSIAREFSVTPGGRFNRDGPFSGEAFRARFLEPAVDRGEELVVDLDGVAGLPSSFLEEAFGGLMRTRKGLLPEQLFKLIAVRASEPDLQPYLTQIRRYVTEAGRAKA
jgi:hypothetical protein